jgi:hypothetical protein
MVKLNNKENRLILKHQMLEVSYKILEKKYHRLKVLCELLLFIILLILLRLLL